MRSGVSIRWRAGLIRIWVVASSLWIIAIFCWGGTRVYMLSKGLIPDLVLTFGPPPALLGATALIQWILRGFLHLDADIGDRRENDATS